MVGRPANACRSRAAGAASLMRSIVLLVPLVLVPLVLVLLVLFSVEEREEDEEDGEDKGSWLLAPAPLMLLLLDARHIASVERIVATAMLQRCRLPQQYVPPSTV